LKGRKILNFVALTNRRTIVTNSMPAAFQLHEGFCMDQRVDLYGGM